MNHVQSVTVLLCVALVVSLVPLASLAGAGDRATDPARGMSRIRRRGFVHPGCLSTREDLERMRTKVTAGEEPWHGCWERLLRNTDGFLDDKPIAQSPIKAGGGGGENYIRLARDCAKAYQCALRFRVSGEKAHADKAVEILNAWVATMKEWRGDTNVSLRAGIYGYQLACAAELMRDHGGWGRADFAAFQDWIVELFYKRNADFIRRRHGTVAGHYWANWDLANMASIMAIGVLCDDVDVFKEGLDYFHHGVGNGAIRNAVYHIHPNGKGQWQESGRDQGHATMGIPLMATICEIAWNQGFDLYGHDGNRFLAGCEYVAKFNLGHDVPYVAYFWEHGHPGRSKLWVQRHHSTHGRGIGRPGWEMVYNHYVNRLGMAAPYSKAFAGKLRPEGGGFNYGGNSGGFDQLGFTTLTHSLDPIAKGVVPGAPRAHVRGRRVTLSWTGSAYAKSYDVKRSTTRGGPYTKLATVDASDPCYVDASLRAGGTYYYVVSANDPDGESADGAEASAAPDGQLSGTVIGTEGSYRDLGATRDMVFDGSLGTYFDGPAGVCWAGLDLGEGVEAAVRKVRYCPRGGFAGRMVGGRFQGSDTVDFSAGVIDLYTVDEEPPEGELTTREIGNTEAFRYLRYISPDGGHGNVAEVQFIASTDAERTE